MKAAIRVNGSEDFQMAKVSIYILSQECSKQKVTNHASACSKITFLLENQKYLYHIPIIPYILTVSGLFLKWAEGKNPQRGELAKA